MPPPFLLQWQCGTTIGVAREKVGVATPKNEKILLKITHHGTAAHVEKVVSNYRRGKRLE